MRDRRSVAAVRGDRTLAVRRLTRNRLRDTADDEVGYDIAERLCRAVGIERNDLSGGFSRLYLDPISAVTVLEEQRVKVVAWRGRSQSAALLDSKY